MERLAEQIKKQVYRMAHGIRSNWRVNDYRNHVVKDRPLNNHHIRISSNKSDNSSSSSLHLQHCGNNNLNHGLPITMNKEINRKRISTHPFSESTPTFTPIWFLSNGNFGTRSTSNKINCNKWIGDGDGDDR